MRIVVMGAAAAAVLGGALASNADQYDLNSGGERRMRRRVSAPGSRPDPSPGGSAGGGTGRRPASPAAAGLRRRPAGSRLPQRPT